MSRVARVAVAGDVLDADSLRRAVETTGGRFGRIDTLITPREATAEATTVSALVLRFSRRRAAVVFDLTWSARFSLARSWPRVAESARATS